MRSRILATPEPSEDELVARYIALNPYKPGRANARLVESGMAVWAFIGWLEAANWDEAQAAEDHEISSEQVRAAIAFYKRYKDIIDDRREGNSRIADVLFNDTASQ
jgi:uncharacterized protein (DUF433 family)